MPRGRSRALVALLALRAGRPVSTERLVDELWGASPPATVVTALHGLVSGLRMRMEPDRARDQAPQVLVTKAPGYLLDIPRERVDAHRFRSLVRRAATMSAEERVVVLRQALALWRGPVFADVVLAGPSIGEAVALEELRMGAYEELDVWRRARAALVEGIGVEPGPGLRKIHEAILQHDPALGLEAADLIGSPADDSARDMAARAGELLAAAGSRVYDRHYDAETAQDLFSRAELLLPAEHPQRDVLADRIPEIDLMLGRHSDADARLKRSLLEARRRGDARRESHLHVERARIQLIIGPDPIPMEEIETVGMKALGAAEDAGDDVVVSQACYVLGLIELRRGRIRRMEKLARLGLTAAERSGSPRERLASRWWLALALVEGPTPIDDAITECEELAELGTAQHVGVLTELARLHASGGAPEVARGYIQQADKDLQRRPGLRRPTMFVRQRAAEIELAAGDPDSAEPHLRMALALADDLGEADQRAQLAAKLARVVVDLGHADEAAELAHRSRHTAPRESATAQVLWRAAMAAARSRSNPSGARKALAEAIALVPDELELLAADLSAQYAEPSTISHRSPREVGPHGGLKAKGE